VVAPGFLADPEVRRWLNGVEPAWTILEFNSFNALHDGPSASNHSIRLEANLADAEISGSAVTANALILLRRAAEVGGLKLTATGNLSRIVVGEMCGAMEWPDYDKDELVRYYKVINEPDFLPLHSVRILAQAAKLFRTHGGKLVPTPIPDRFLAPDPSGGHPVVAFSIGPQLAAQKDPHPALRISRDWRLGVAMGFRFQRHGGAHSPTLGLVRASGIANLAQIADRSG
jgi:hypothetical protein